MRSTTAITILVLVLILILARKPLARIARELAKRAARALWKRITTRIFGHCRTCAAVAIPLHTCVVKSKRPVKAATARGIMDKRDARAVKNGWIAPKAKLQPVMVSRECAGGECAICPGDGCACSCNHNPVLIIARNEALYDASTDKIPF